MLSEWTPFHTMAVYLVGFIIIFIILIRQSRHVTWDDILRQLRYSSREWDDIVRQLRRSDKSNKDD